MAVVKKTYSKRNNELTYISEREKENFDPFDELLSSPLKQEVQFKPLSFWDGNKQLTERQNKSKTVKYGLFEASDSDDSSPNNRKKKSKLKYSRCKSRTLPVKISNNSNNEVISNNPCRVKSRSTRATTALESAILKQSKKEKKQSSDNLLGSSPNKALNSTYKSKYIRGSKNESPKSYSKSQKELKKSNEESMSKCNVSNVKYKIYEDENIIKQNSEGDCDEEKITCQEREESKNFAVKENDSMDETIVPFCSNRDSFMFINMKRHYSFESFNFDDIFNSSDSDENQEHLSQSLSTHKISKLPQNLAVTNPEPQNLTFTYHEDSNGSHGNTGNTTSYDGGDEMESELTISPFSFNESGENVSLLCQFEGEDFSDKTLVYYKEDSMSSTLCESDVMGEMYSIGNKCSLMSSKTETVLESLNESTLLDKFDFNFSDISRLEDLSQDLLLENTENSTAAVNDSALDSNENSSFNTDEESVIRVSLKSCTKDTQTAGGADELDPSSTKVSHLANEMSQMTIKPTEEFEDVEEPGNLKTNSDSKDARNNSVLIDLRNVTTKRKYRARGKFERVIINGEETRSDANPSEGIRAEDGLGEGVEESGATDWNRSAWFGQPILESTRVGDVNAEEAGNCTKVLNQSDRMTSLLEDSQFWAVDHSFVLKPGKKWLRAVSVLKQIRKGNMSSLDCSRVKGRKFESFVRDMLEMQNGKPGWSASLADLRDSKDFSVHSFVRAPFSQSVCEGNGSLGSASSLQDVSLNNSIFSAGCSDKTVLDTSIINPTIKIIPTEEKPSALGLEISDFVLEGECSFKNKSTNLSARDFILIQCGQEDVLPFEEYFNERTLKDCVKIGEGVYGEVFRSSDAVIKIIPIEGTERVNGETQKKFDEILSEVVIALKLSKLRYGERNRSDGFCEMKRCWCVKGRYPKYLLRLWNEFDQLGNGSENDSPIMFKDDQLYIILELANGGRDLESFVFSSSAQSLSIFIQTALSLAAAEKAFEFEHRDLHWGNVLISPTKEKFVTIVVDGFEYKIPSKGVKVCIIDFTLSRIYDEGFCIFNDLSADPSLFQSEGDYQFEIYKMMLKEVKNDWSLFRPKTNIFWLHYVLDKMISMINYKSAKGKLHRKYEEELKNLESIILNHNDATGFVLSDAVREVMTKL